MNKTTSRPLVRLQHTPNRTPTGRRSVTPARKAARYIAFGNDRQARRVGRQRGEWVGPGGHRYDHRSALAWAEDQARQQEQTFHALLSVPRGRLSGKDYARALEQAGQIPDFRLMVHDDTAYSHAHVLFFRNRRLKKETYLRWQAVVARELAAAEQKQLAGQTLERELAPEQEAPFWQRSPRLGLG